MTSVAAQVRKRSTWMKTLIGTMVTPHAADRYLELVDPMVTLRDLRAEVTDVHQDANQSVILTLRPTRQWRGFEAGQFVSVGVVIDGVRHTRCYSPCDSQHRADGRIELTVKAHDGGLVSQHLRAHARPGLVVDLAQASGDFHLPSPRPADIVLISGGSGITPVLSMLRTLADEGFGGRVVFLHYASEEAGVPHLAELRRVADAHENVDLVLAYTRAPGGDLHGHFSVAHLDAAAPWHMAAQTYLCGPPGLMDSVADVYEGLGLTDRLHTEQFVLTTTDPDGDASGALSFTASAVSAENSGATILEQAEAAGLTPEHGCRMGICFSCTAVKRSGCTKNIRTGALASDPDQPIQLCINVPVGDVAIDI